MSAPQETRRRVDHLLEELLQSGQLLHNAADMPRDEEDDRSAAVLVALEVMGAKVRELKKAMTRTLYAGVAQEARAAQRLLARSEFAGAELVLPGLEPGYSPDLILRQATGDTVVEVKGPRAELTEAASRLANWAHQHAPLARRVVAVVGAQPKHAPVMPSDVELIYLP
jgi:hypothetical protein